MNKGGRLLFDVNGGVPIPWHLTAENFVQKHSKRKHIHWS